MIFTIIILALIAISIISIIFQLIMSFSRIPDPADIQKILDEKAKRMEK